MGKISNRSLSQPTSQRSKSKAAQIEALISPEARSRRVERQRRDAELREHCKGVRRVIIAIVAAQYIWFAVVFAQNYGIIADIGSLLLIMVFWLVPVGMICAACMEKFSRRGRALIGAILMIVFAIIPSIMMPLYVISACPRNIQTVQACLPPVHRNIYGFEVPNAKDYEAQERRPLKHNMPIDIQ